LWRNAAAACVLVVVATTAFTIALLRHHRDDVSCLVVAGGPGVDPARVPPGLTVIPNIAGYDGFIYYRLALDPFSRQQTAYGITLVDMPYRQQRILYPATVWMLSCGRPTLVPTLLLLVNEASIVAIAIIGCLIARSFGIAPAWGALFAMYPGFLHTLAHDTAEIVAAAFVLAGIAALLRHSSWTAALMFSAAVLTRETTIILPCAAAAAWAWSVARRSPTPFSPAVFLAPIATFAAVPIITTLSAWRWVLAATTIPIWAYLALHIVR